MQTMDTCFLPNRQILIDSQPYLCGHFIVNYMNCNEPFLLEGKKSFSWQHVNVLGATVHQIGWYVDVNF